MKDAEFYANCDKLYWEMNKRLVCPDGIVFERNQRVPCLFVMETGGGKYKILLLDPDIEKDNFRYTAFRSIIGYARGERIHVFLIYQPSARYFSLDGTEINFNTLLPDDGEPVINKEWLAKMEVKNPIQRV